MRNPKQYRLELAKQLTEFGRILSRSGITDEGPFTQAANECRTHTTKDPDIWQYSLSSLTFRPGSTGRTVPSTADDVTLILDVTAAGRCNVGPSEDPLVYLTTELAITASFEQGKGKEPKVATCSWHLDRNIPQEESKDDEETSEESGEQEYMHPDYHFHFGGRHIWQHHESGTDFGSALILEPPRLAHPPLEAILGVDFVLTNFYKQTDLLFRLEDDYKTLIQTVQERIWKPYINALATAWYGHGIHVPWRADKIWPQIPMPEAPKPSDAKNPQRNKTKTGRRSKARPGYRRKG